MDSHAKKFYAVAKGHNPGIYEKWTTAHTARFPGAIHKSFDSYEEARQYIDSYNLEHPTIQPDKIPTQNISLLLESLTEEQHTVIHYLLEDNNIFLTGGGGVGKSFILSAIYTEYPGLKKFHSSSITSKQSGTKLPNIQLCALTGCAALLLGYKAKTIHSWAGIGLGKGTVSELCIKIRKNRKSMRNWISTDLLIIDEISMMTAELLDKLNEIGKRIRRNTKPFGGIQVLFVGDFFQIPPVNKTSEPTMFAFESAAWKEAALCSIELTKIHRQKDEVFQRVLKEARVGALSKESCSILEARQGLNWKENKIRPTLLFPRRAEVDMINDSNLRALSGRRYTYKARLVYDGKMPDRFCETDEGFQRTLQMFDSNAAYSTQLELMLDAQVMLIANTDPDSGLVNGSRGVIVGFCPHSELPIVEFINGIKKPVGHHTWPIEEYEFVSRSQIPLRLAFACTTHKIQGSSLDSALVDIGSSNFEFGQAYVALSRSRSLDALYVYDFDPLAFKAHPKVKQFYSELQTKRINEDEQLLLISCIRDFKAKSCELDNKPIMSESSKPIQAINVVKLDTDDAIIETIVEEPPHIESSNWLYDSMPSGWVPCLLHCQDKLLELSNTLSTKEFLPSRENIWRALELVSLESIKVVILGQDPYPTPGNACGLAFSVTSDVKILPASLRNIYKELAADGFITQDTPLNGNLESWAKQGVLLLNTVLTVEAGLPQSHSKIGWEEITDQIIRTIAAKTHGCIFVLWGKSAQAKKKLLGLYLDKNGHHLIESAHPSPLSATKGFFGSKPFSKANELLDRVDKGNIDW